MVVVIYVDICKRKSTTVVDCCALLSTVVHCRLINIHYIHSPSPSTFNVLGLILDDVCRRIISYVFTTNKNHKT